MRVDESRDDRPDRAHKRRGNSYLRTLHQLREQYDADIGRHSRRKNHGHYPLITWSGPHEE